MKAKTIGYNTFLDEMLKDPKTAAAYLNEAIKEFQKNGNKDQLLLALMDVARAKGLSSIAKKTGKSRPSLYKSFCKTGDPKFSTILDILPVLNLKIEFSSSKKQSKAA